MTTGTEVQLYEDLELEQRLMVAVERSAVAGDSFAVFGCVPQRLSGEDISEVVATVAQYVTEIVRDGDVVGLLDGDIIVIGLTNTGPNQARVFAHRLQGDLRLYSQRVRNTVWEIGYACLPEDGEASDELLLGAVEGALTRRRRLGG